MLTGSTLPRLWSRPLRELTPESSYGFAAIEFAEQVLQIGLYPWQRWLLIHLLELMPDGRLRFRTVILIVSRQNGKTTVVKVLALFFLYLLRTALIIGTAQNLDVAEEAWQDTVELAEEVPELAAEIRRIDKANGKKALTLTTGERYKVTTASRRGGRGLAGDLIILDELREHIRWDAWAAVTKTTLARDFALVLGLSTAGDISSVVLRYLRRIALGILADAGDAAAAAEMLHENRGLKADVDEEPGEDDVGGAETVGIFEWSAAPGADPRDDGSLTISNPSLGYGSFSERGLKSARLTDPPHIFAQECLGLWSQTTTTGPFPPGQWLAGCDAASRIAEESQVAACVDVAWSRDFAHVAVAGFRADGQVHVEIVATRAGVAWLPDWLAERQGKHGFVAVAAQQRGAPVSSLIEKLSKIEGLPVLPWGGTDLGGAAGTFEDLIKAGHLWHLPQPVLDVPAATAVWRTIGDARVIDRQRSPEDAAPLVAAMGAVWALQANPPEPKVSAYEERRLISV